MEQYFQDVVSSLSMEDMEILGYLLDNEATANFKAIKTNEVQKACGFTEAKYRKCIYRLTGNKFIETVVGNRQFGICITQYGMAALETTLKGVSA